MQFVLTIDPIPKGRPRFQISTGIVYTPSMTKNYEIAIREQTKRILKLKDDQGPLYFGPLAVDVDFLYRRPQVLNAKKCPNEPILRHTGDDLDNLVKALLDALNGVIWKDDTQIVALRVRKMVMEKHSKPIGRICVVVREVKHVTVEYTCEANEVHREYVWGKILGLQQWDGIDLSIPPMPEDDDDEESRQAAQEQFLMDGFVIDGPEELQDGPKGEKKE